MTPMLMFAAILAMFSVSAHAQYSLPASSLQAQGLQMPDGTKRFRISLKLPTGEEVEMRTIDMIAQGLANIHWCGNGWEETKRTAATLGITLIEGRCKE